MLLGRSRVFGPFYGGLRWQAGDFRFHSVGNWEPEPFCLQQEVELMAAEMSFQCESKKKPGAWLGVHGSNLRVR